MYPLNKKANRLLSENGWNTDYPKNKDLEWKQQVSKGIYVIVDKPDFSFKEAVVNLKNINQSCDKSVAN